MSGYTDRHYTHPGFNVLATPVHLDVIIPLRDVEVFAYTVAKYGIIRIIELHHYSFLINVISYEDALRLTRKTKLLNGTRMRFQYIEVRAILLIDDERVVDGDILDI